MIPKTNLSLALALNAVHLNFKIKTYMHKRYKYTEKNASWAWGRDARPSLGVDYSMLYSMHTLPVAREGGINGDVGDSTTKPTYMKVWISMLQSGRSRENTCKNSKFYIMVRYSYGSTFSRTLNFFNTIYQCFMSVFRRSTYLTNFLPFIKPLHNSIKF